MNNRGFTLIETILYITLLSIILTSAIGMFFSVSMAARQTAAAVSVEDTGNILLQKFEYDAINSLPILFPPALEIPGLSSSSVTYISINGTNLEKISISFSIYNHLFTFDQIKS